MATVSKLKAKSPTLIERRRPKICIYGKSGAGKTYGSLEFPKCYYIDAEGGAKESHYKERLLKAGAGYFDKEDGAGDLKEILNQIKALATEEHDYQTLIIDSITKPYNELIGLEQERLGDKDQYGQSKKPAIALMRALYTWIDRVDMNVIIISHVKDEYGMVNGKREVIGTTFDAHEKLEYELDLAAEIVMQGESRYMKIRKSRIQSFENGRQYAWNYNDFADRYGRDDIERGMHKVVLVSKEDADEINRLVQILKIDDETTSKWTGKAGIDSFDEFTEEQAQKILEFLRSKINIKAA